MGKNKGRGGKTRRRGKKDTDDEKREVRLKEPGQEYAQVLRMLGNGRLQLYCFDSVKRLGHIRGRIRRRRWMGVGDIILVGLRSYQDDKCDVLDVYAPDEARRLKKLGELPVDAKLEEEGARGENQGNRSLAFEIGMEDASGSEENSADLVAAQPDRYGSKGGNNGSYFDYDMISSEETDSGDFDAL
eukprot:TRINITY_DN2100_c0_g1_i1.p1 TRINITY_DN2100_c0_g1~~TRINITY_DN2100_c0_g1_i1.p1  ORF type:complete len:187 (+),score=64.80 TRINITY_DN2100_c0_g1_i1:627-1187(+)